MYINTTITDSEFLYVADSANNMIRTVTAVCSKICENGGECVREETCQCPFGWQGDDCTIPVCSETCKSLPYVLTRGRGVPEPVSPCRAVHVQQSCVHCAGRVHVQARVHGRLVRPADVCPGLWRSRSVRAAGHVHLRFRVVRPKLHDTSVRHDVRQRRQLHGSGRVHMPRALARSSVPAPSVRSGANRRASAQAKVRRLLTPTDASQTCLHGGQCVAPNTCRCPPEWSGFDCSKPVCQQGFLRADPTPHEAPPGTARHDEWRLYSPCNISDWCDSTQGFDCRQFQRSYHTIQVPPWRDITGTGAAQHLGAQHPRSCSNHSHCGCRPQGVTSTVPHDGVRANC